MTAERELARCKGFDFAIERGCNPSVRGAFEGKGWGQGFGYTIDVQFLLGLMLVFNVERLQQVNDKPCWVTHTYDSILLVEPLFPGEGTPFDVAEGDGGPLIQLELPTQAHCTNCDPFLVEEHQAMVRACADSWVRSMAAQAHEMEVAELSPDQAAGELRHLEYRRRLFREELARRDA